MITLAYQRRFSLIFRYCASVVLMAFCLTSLIPAQVVYAQGLNLPPAGQMISLSNQYKPAVIKGIKIDPHNPLAFNFLMDPGQKPFNQSQKKKEYEHLIKYFLASLTIPEKDMWVNLSPYESHRIVSDNFGATQMGRDMLAQDYILKQLTSSLTYPEKEIGKKFWDKIYSQVSQELGSKQIPVNTFNKVWIVPNEAVVFEKGNVAMIVGGRLKVMMEEDYLSLDKHHNAQKLGFSKVEDVKVKGMSKNASDIVREVILPVIEREVNEGEHFAQLRQMYHSMILASWFKKRLKQHLLGRVLVNQNKDVGLQLQDVKDNERIYQEYLKAFKKGAYNYIKEETNLEGQIIPKKYFSGGMKFDMMMDVKTTSNPTSIMPDAAMETEEVPVVLRPMQDSDQALIITSKDIIGMIQESIRQERESRKMYAPSTSEQLLIFLRAKTNRSLNQIRNPDELQDLVDKLARVDMSDSEEVALRDGFLQVLRERLEQLKRQTLTTQLKVEPTPQLVQPPEVVLVSEKSEENPPKRDDVKDSPKYRDTYANSNRGVIAAAILVPFIAIVAWIAVALKSDQPNGAPSLVPSGQPTRTAITTVRPTGSTHEPVAAILTAPLQTAPLSSNAPATQIVNPDSGFAEVNFPTIDTRETYVELMPPGEETQIPSVALGERSHGYSPIDTVAVVAPSNLVKKLSFSSNAPANQIVNPDSGFAFATPTPLNPMEEEEPPTIDTRETYIELALPGEETQIPSVALGERSHDYSPVDTVAAVTLPKVVEKPVPVLTVEPQPSYNFSKIEAGSVVGTPTQDPHIIPANDYDQLNELLRKIHKIMGRPTFYHFKYGKNADPSQTSFDQLLSKVKTNIPSLQEKIDSVINFIKWVDATVTEDNQISLEEDIKTKLRELTAEIRRLMKLTLEQRLAAAQVQPTFASPEIMPVVSTNIPVTNLPSYDFSSVPDKGGNQISSENPATVSITFENFAKQVEVIRNDETISWKEKLRKVNALYDAQTKSPVNYPGSGFPWVSPQLVDLVDWFNQYVEQMDSLENQLKGLKRYTPKQLRLQKQLRVIQEKAESVMDQIIQLSRSTSTWTSNSMENRGNSDKNFSSNWTRNSQKVGGIDFDDQYLNMHIKSDGASIAIPKRFEWLLHSPIRGFIPHILDIQHGIGYTLSFFNGLLSSQEIQQAKFQHERNLLAMPFRIREEEASDISLAILSLA